MPLLQRLRVAATRCRPFLIARTDLHGFPTRQGVSPSDDRYLGIACSFTATSSFTPSQRSRALAGQAHSLMRSDLGIALALCAATLAVSYGLWRFVHVRHSGRILTCMAIVAAALMIAPGNVPGIPHYFVAVGLVLAVVVTLGILYWRNRDEPGDWADVASVRYVKPVSRAERVGTGVAGLLLLAAILGPVDVPLRTRILAAWLLPIAWSIVIRGQPPRDRSGSKDL